jgi:hypothetical protein
MKHKSPTTVIVNGRNGNPDRLASRVPWTAATPQPWDRAYSRVRIDYTPAELAAAIASGSPKRQHEQVVANTRLSLPAKSVSITRETGVRWAI